MLHSPLELLLVHAVLEQQPALVEGLRDARAHLLGVEGLGDVVEGTELEARDGALHLRHAGHDDDGAVGPAGGDLAQQGFAVHLRHPQVGDDEGHRLPLHDLQRLRSGARLGAGEALSFEQPHQHAPESGFVVHDEALESVRFRHTSA